MTVYVQYPFKRSFAQCAIKLSSSMREEPIFSAYTNISGHQTGGEIRRANDL